MVTVRSPWSIIRHMAFSSVVLPEPVPPEIRMLRRPRPAIFSTVAMSGEMLPCRAITSSVISFLENLRIEMVGPSMASGGMMMLTRLPSLRRASTSGVELVDAAADLGDDAGGDVQHVRVVAEHDVGQLDLALALDVDLVRAVDHDVGDGLVGEQRLERAEADHVVDEQPHDRAQLGGVELDLQVDDDLLDDLGDLVAQLVGAERGGDRDVDALHQQRHHLLP